MVSKNEFWTSVEKGILNSDSANGARVGLYDIANSTLAIRESLEMLPEFLEQNNDIDVKMRYFVCRGYLFTLNYYRDNPETSEESKAKANTLIKLGLLISDLEDKKNSSSYKEKIRVGLQSMLRESLLLLKQETQKINLKETLNSVQDKKGYLDNYMGVKKSQRRNIAGFIIDKTYSDQWSI